MTDILQEIVAHKRCDIDRLLQKRVSMAESLRQSKSGIIAEFKRRSPSKGWIHADVEPEQVIPIQRVLPDVGKCPILRKEFIIDPYQVYESKFLGADAILLIAADLTPEEYAALLTLSHRLNLEVLLEVHDPQELEYLRVGVPDMLGVNNRSLGTFHTDVQHSFDIADAMQTAVANIDVQSPVLVSESGISDPETVRELRKAEFRGFLIGECFMKEPDPAQALATFVKRVETSPLTS